MKFESLIDEFYQNNKISHNKIIKTPSDGKLTLFKSDLKNPVNGDLSFVSFEELLSKNKLIFKILNNLYYFENFIVIAPKLKVGSTKPSFFLKLYINFDSLKIKENDGFLDKSSQYICDSFESAIIISDSEKKLFKELDVIIRDNLNYFTSKQKKDVLNELETTVLSKTNKSTPKPKKTTPKPKKSKSDSKSGGCILLILVITVVSYFVFSPSDRSKCLERSDNFTAKELSGVWSGKDDLYNHNQYEIKLTLNSDKTYSLTTLINGIRDDHFGMNHSGNFYTSSNNWYEDLYDHYLFLEWNSPNGKRTYKYEISYIIKPESGSQSKWGKTETYEKGFYLYPTTGIFSGSSSSGIILKGDM
tara:strand:+ start:820 stop:1899 length:1080 start_codon:yes stop_codon:yes gene_type:complete